MISGFWDIQISVMWIQITDILYLESCAADHMFIYSRLQHIIANIRAVLPAVVCVGSSGCSMLPRALGGACWQQGREPCQILGCRRGLNTCPPCCWPETTETQSWTSPPAPKKSFSVKHLQLNTTARRQEHVCGQWQFWSFCLCNFKLS